MTAILTPIAGFLTFIGLTLVFFGLASRRRVDPLQARVEQFGQAPRSLEDLEMQASFGERFLRPLISGLARTVGRFTPNSASEATMKRIRAAGMQGQMQASDFLGLKGLGFVIGLVVGILVAFGFHSSFFGYFVFAVAFALAGYVAPDFWLRSRTDGRKTEIQNELPDTIDLLTISVEAGLGFDQALGRIVSKSNNTLAREFGQVLQQMRLGVPRREALRQMADRTGVDDVTQFVGAIVQAEQLGASVGRVLRVQSAEMRVRRRQRAQRLAQQAPIKMLFPMAFLILPAIFTVVLGPAIPRIVLVFAPGLPL